MPKAPPYTITFPASMVREARGLDVYEKAFLFLLASHHSLTSTRSRKSVEQSVGFRGNRIYAVRKKLRDKNLIRWTEGPLGTHTVYELDKDALLRWVEDPDAAALWESNDRALRDDRPRPMRPRRLGKSGVGELLASAHRRPKPK
ncbi:hypothetical protein C3B59_18260 [Cryobacterium zongtaii]|uniref:Uncharacterized protein n=1 Tax=Cryobacterium zongtaii TaxID=1259217 RepID=A0A2S3Z5E5_9MICO|nr:hypothetical protein C3B59_18260 [Cryobacterium zongtaii]